MDRAADMATAVAIAEGEWLTAIFFDDVPDGAVAYELEHPADWFVQDEGGWRVVVSNYVPDAPWEFGSGVAATFELMVCDDCLCADDDGGLGEPDDVYEPDADMPFDDSWTLSYSACNNGHELTALAEFGPTTDPETAAAYLALVERVADSVRFIDLPLVDEEWTTTLIQNGRTELNTPGTHPGRSRYDYWRIGHPVSWSVSPAAPDSVGWEMSGPMGAISPGEAMMLRMDPLTSEAWADTESGTDAAYLSHFRSAWRLPDETTQDGRRRIRHGIEGPRGKAWVVTADVPDPGDGAEATGSIELLIAHLLLRTHLHESIEFPEGYPGRP